MICGVNGWKLLEPAMSVIGELESVDVFVYEENACVRISINEAIEHLYAGKSKWFQQLNSHCEKCSLLVRYKDIYIFIF